jgi:hypothetical protein
MAGVSHDCAVDGGETSREREIDARAIPEVILTGAAPLMAGERPGNARSTPEPFPEVILTGATRIPLYK